MFVFTGVDNWLIMARESGGIKMHWEHSAYLISYTDNKQWQFYCVMSVFSGSYYNVNVSD